MKTEIKQVRRQWTAKTVIPLGGRRLIVRTEPSGGAPKTFVDMEIGDGMDARPDPSWKTIMGYLLGFDARNTRVNVERAQQNAIAQVHHMRPWVFDVRGVKYDQDGKRVEVRMEGTRFHVAFTHKDVLVAEWIAETVDGARRRIDHAIAYAKHHVAGSRIEQQARWWRRLRQLNDRLSRVHRLYFDAEDAGKGAKYQRVLDLVRVAIRTHAEAQSAAPTLF